MQVAALKPLYTSDSEVSAEYIEHEIIWLRFRTV